MRFFGKKWSRLLSAVIILLAVIPFPGNGQIVDASLAVRDSIASSVLDETRMIRIALPPNYNAPGQVNTRYPVVIVLDAESHLHFTAAVANARALALATAPMMPDVIVVGIEMSPRTRVRDTTPPPLQGPARFNSDAGGAPAFADFIVNEVLPLVARRFRSLPYTVIVGHSMTGQFAAYIYGQHPTKINAAVAISSSFGWNGGVTYRQILEAIRARKLPGRLFVTASRDEDSYIFDASKQLARDMADHPTSTSFQFRELSDIGHYHTPLQGSIDGLRYIFEPISIPTIAIRSGIEVNTAEDAVRKYADIRRQYLAGVRAFGLPERMPVAYVLGSAAWMIDDSTLVAAIPAMCQDIADSYPDLWQGSECVGRAFLRLGKLDDSAKAFQAALAVARRSNAAAGIAAADAGLQAVARARQ